MAFKNELMTHREMVNKWLAGKRVGVELGAFVTPIPGISPFYVDCFEEYAGQKCLLDFKGDACHLPFRDNSLDYVASSHVLEHVANPVLALHEWGRVLKNGGVIYSVIPDKRYTWDRDRPTTAASHLIEDYRNGVDQRDYSHVDDFIDGIAWEEYAPGKTLEEKEAYRNLLRESAKIGNEINIHFHTFVPDDFDQIIKEVNASELLPYKYRLEEVVRHFPETVPNGFLAIITVQKDSLLDRAEGAINSARCAIRPEFAVRPGTRRFIRRAE